MAVRPSVVQVFEIGVEASPGSAAALSRQLRSLTWDITPQAEIDELRASGSKYVTMTALNREWSTGSIGGEPDYNEIVYPLSSVIGRATATSNGSAAAGESFQWVFNSDTDGLDAFDTFTAVKGDANHGEKITGLIVDGFTFDVTRQDASISGSFLAGRLTIDTPVSGTAAFITDTQRPILPGHVNVYMDDAFGDLGTTKLEYDFRFMFEISGRHLPIWTLDRSENSFKETVEGPPTVGATLQLMADGTASALVNTMRLGDMVFVRAEAVGGTTAAGTTSYTFQIDTALQVISAPSMTDLDGLYVYEWGFRAVHSADWDRAFEITVVNAIEEL